MACSRRRVRCRVSGRTRAAESSPSPPRCARGCASTSRRARRSGTPSSEPTLRGFARRPNGSPIIPRTTCPSRHSRNILEMRRLAAEVAAAKDLPQAARGAARLAAACGACHTAIDVTPTLMAAMPRREDETLAGHMRKHYRAADLLYRGLVVPSEHSWNTGAAALAGDPTELELRRGPTARPRSRPWPSDSTAWRRRPARPAIRRPDRRSTGGCSRPAPTATSCRRS